MSNPQSLPLFDLFLDLPHPAAAASCPPAYISGCPAANNPEIEKELSANMSQISRFAFPEFDDSIEQRIPRDVALNRFSQYAMGPKSFQNFTFSLQLKSGVRVHGFVRRYLPIHQVVEHRYDVGRRGERALVMLTRFCGGDLLYTSILKTIDAISFQKSALSSKYVHPEPQKWFLNRLFEEHRKLCNAFLSTPQQERKPMMLTVRSIEVGEKPLPLLSQADTANYLVPTSLLAKTSTVEALTSSAILPLLRVLGVSSTLRLLSALLSENRVLLISGNPTRLAQCSRSALSILAQGLLNWQHIYIPVLPPHLFQYLGAPVPYLIGMLTSFIPKLNQVKADGLGELVIINLDNNQMETRGMNPMEVAQKVPDLFQKAISEQGMPASSISASEMLAQDLLDLLKIDKRAIYGESTLTNVSETAAKATKAMKSGISNLARKGKNFFNNRKGSLQDIDISEEETVDPNITNGTQDIDQITMSPEAVYIQGSQNEIAEEEARIAFSSFFLSMFGNMRWYLSASPGKLPHLDRKRFLQQKRAMGEGESTSIWPVLQNFCQTQMLEEFAKARVEEVRLRLPVTSDSPLFTQCANYHRLNNIDFSVVNVRRVARQVAQSNPSRLIIQTSTRRTAMLLTSNKTYDGNYNKAVAQIVEQCRECTSVLFDVMSVIWVRLRDSKGVHWKHGHQALQLLRNLLYHGPMAAIAEATDGLDKIRKMKFYNDNMRSQICTQIRQTAHQVYNLIVDRAKLFKIRRICLNKRRLLRQPEQARYTKDPRISITHRFGAMHQLLNPKSSVRVAPAPLVLHAPQPIVVQHVFGLTTSSTTGAVEVTAAPTSVAGATQDMIGLFGNVAVSNQSSVVPSPAPAPQARDPFAQAPVPKTQALTPPRQIVPPNVAVSNQSYAVPSPAPAPHARDPFSSAPMPNAYAQSPVPPGSSHGAQQQAPMSNAYNQSPVPPGSHAAHQQPSHLVQQRATGAQISGQPVAYYGNTHSQNAHVSAPPQQHQPMPPQQQYQPQQQQQQYYQPHPSGQHNSTHNSSGQGQQGGYTMPPPQQQQQHQQYNQIGGQQRPPSQHQPLPPAQPKKPNLSQFDPFQ